MKSSLPIKTSIPGSCADSTVQQPVGTAPSLRYPDGPPTRMHTTALNCPTVALAPYLAYQDASIAHFSRRVMLSVNKLCTKNATNTPFYRFNL